MEMLDAKTALILFCLCPVIGLISAAGGIFICEAAGFAARRLRKLRRHMRNGVNPCNNNRKQGKDKHTIKKIIAWFYFWILRWPLLAVAKWPDDIEEYLGYCCNGCENCYSWGCSARVSGKTPYRKYRRYKRKKK